MPVKPRLLLADDHAELLKSVTRLLAVDFDVVASVPDGYRALDACQQWDPDAVVLDVTMPGLDGFQTARELKRRGSRASIVYLTMHESEEFVAEGFRAGGNGYVVKTRLHVDLVNALNHVLAGRAFIPSLTSLLAIDNSHGDHAALFYADDHSLVDELADFFARALRRGDAVSAVFPHAIRAGLAERLQARGWSVGESGVHGRYCAVDSTAAMLAVTRDGRVDRDAVAETLRKMEHLRVTTAESASARLTIAGQISVPLLSTGNTQAASDLEHIWSELTRSMPFLTVCCYPMEGFSGRPQTDVLPSLCSAHGAVAYTPDSGAMSASS